MYYRERGLVVHQIMHSKSDDKERESKNRVNYIRKYDSKKTVTATADGKKTERERSMKIVTGI